MSFSPADHERIAEAIRAAESATTGEIFAVFAKRSDSYFYVSSFFALLLSFGLGLAAALALYASGHAMPLLAFEAAEILGAAILIALLRLSEPLRMLFVPQRVRHFRAHKSALAQFMAHNIRATAARTGVLIFVSEAEHFAEIVADEGIAAKVPQEAWNGIVAALVQAAREDRLADGYVEAARSAGALLARHFPAAGKNPNEIPDRLVEI